MRLLILSAVLLAALPVAAQQAAPEASPCTPYAGVPNLDSWIHSAEPANFPDHISAAREKKLRAAYSSIEIGSSRAAVEKGMGKPDFENIMHAGSMGKPNGKCFIQWAYLFRKADVNPINPEDAGIYLTFSEDGRLYWAQPQNLDLKPKGSVVQK